MMKHNNAKFPEEGFKMIRLHSCYPLHKGGAYKKLLASGDEGTLEAVRKFNEFDLYTKADKRPDVNELWPYYQKLIDEYCPGKLDW